MADYEESRVVVPESMGNFVYIDDITSNFVGIVWDRTNPSPTIFKGVGKTAEEALEMAKGLYNREIGNNDR
jgi:hypothetical protein